MKRRHSPHAATFGMFNDAYRPIMDGVSVCVEQYALWLNRKYGRCWVMVPRVPGYEDEPEVPVIRYGAIPFAPIKPYRIGLPLTDIRFRSRIRSLRFDLVHSHSPFNAGALALRTARRQEIPLVATFHSKYREDFQRFLGLDLLTELGIRYIVSFYEQADQVWTPSDATGEILREYGYRGRIEVVPNGTDMEIPDPQQYAAYRARGAELVGGDPGEPLFLFVGQHRWEKNVRLIIESLAVLAREYPRFRVAFVGEGYAANEMQEMVRRQGIEDRVRFLGLVLDREVLKGLYARAYAFLFPSLYDNAPLVMREAASFGCPSVLARGSSAAAGLEDGREVFLTEDDPAAMAALLLRLVRDPDLARAVGREARKRIYLSWETVADQVHERYRDLIRSFRARSRGTSARRPHLLSRR